jgi:hypothetical protein
MKYTVNTYGWSGEFVAKKLTKEQLEKVDSLLEERDTTNVADIRFDLEDELGIDMLDGDIFQTVRGLNNNTMLFQVRDEDGELVLEFGIEDIKNVLDENDDMYGDMVSYEVTPTEDYSVYLSVDEFKGGIFSYEFESDVTPKVEDFKYVTGSVDTPDGDWDIIEGIYYDGEKLEIYDYLDNSGKAATVEIFKSEEPVFKYNPNLCACHPDNGGDGTCQCD